MKSQPGGKRICYLALGCDFLFLFTALHAETACYGCKDGDKEIDDFLNDFFLHRQKLFIINYTL